VHQFDPQVDKTDLQDQMCDAANSPNEGSLGLTTAHKEEDATSKFQEGGIQGWAAVIGAILIQFCGFGYVNAFGVFQDYYTRVDIKNESASTISWIGSVNAFLILLSGIYANLIFAFYAITNKTGPLSPEFSCAGDRLWVTKYCGGFTLFQKETDFGYNFCIGWRSTR